MVGSLAVVPLLRPSRLQRPDFRPFQPQPSTCFHHQFHRRRGHPSSKAPQPVSSLRTTAQGYLMDHHCDRHAIYHRRIWPSKRSLHRLSCQPNLWRHEQEMHPSVQSQPLSRGLKYSHTAWYRDVISMDAERSLLFRLFSCFTWLKCDTHISRGASFWKASRREVVLIAIGSSKGNLTPAGVLAGRLPLLIGTSQLSMRTIIKRACENTSKKIPTESQELNSARWKY